MAVRADMPDLHVAGCDDRKGPPAFTLPHQDIAAGCPQGLQTARQCRQVGGRYACKDIQRGQFLAGYGAALTKSTRLATRLHMLMRTHSATVGYGRSTRLSSDGFLYRHAHGTRYGQPHSSTPRYGLRIIVTALVSAALLLLGVQTPRAGGDVLSHPA